MPMNNSIVGARIPIARVKSLYDPELAERAPNKPVSRGIAMRRPIAALALEGAMTGPKSHDNPCAESAGYPSGFQACLRPSIKVLPYPVTGFHWVCMTKPQFSDNAAFASSD